MQVPLDVSCQDILRHICTAHSKKHPKQLPVPYTGCFALFCKHQGLRLAYVPDISNAFAFSGSSTAHPTVLHSY